MVIYDVAVRWSALEFQCCFVLKAKSTKVTSLFSIDN
jgi:hypothetical protein